MSRSNPYIQKRSAAKTTLLVFGEGLAEEAFLKHLRGIYARNSGIGVTIRKGKGGDAASIVVDASNVPGSFDRKIVVLDNDKEDTEMGGARSEATSRQIELIENSPCLESTLLSILNDGKSFSAKGSSWCKAEFESKYIEKKKRSEPSELIKVFPKPLLDMLRTKVSVLNRMITLMEENNEET